ncbi:MAG: PfkB family carbohydrate kinase [SAR202 cluster bacterium]|nr:PfkB family carbohydrate kinase [SAR202 cluster bacterium]
MTNSKMESNLQIMGIGEILWDIFPEGKRFGGAPANFACQAQALGTNTHMVSCVGRDQLGLQILSFLETRQINTSSIAFSDRHPTGTVQVQLNSSGHPKFKICGDSAWDFIPWSERLALLASTTNAVCYGTLVNGARCREILSTASSNLYHLTAAYAFSTLISGNSFTILHWFDNPCNLLMC